MKKIFCLLMFVLPLPVCAATTCIHNNTAVFTLKKSVNGISSSYDADAHTWTVVFDYDLIQNVSGRRQMTGRSTCNEIGTNSSGSNAVAGNANVYLRSGDTDVGRQCWCAMTAPLSSWWVFYKTYDSDSACATGCARDCAAAVKSNTGNFRSNGVFMAIW